MFNTWTYYPKAYSQETYQPWGPLSEIPEDVKAGDLWRVHLPLWALDSSSVQGTPTPFPSFSVLEKGEREIQDTNPLPPHGLVPDISFALGQ